jgi:hypothetical protein
VRIGTWNLAGRWTPDHLDLLVEMDCDVLLLTEVSERLVVDGYEMHLGEAEMAAKRRWAGVLSREPLTALPDPHRASAMASVGEWTFCSSVLPWVGGGAHYPDGVGGHAESTAAAAAILMGSLPTGSLVWGGDWNQDLEGRVRTGSRAGRSTIADAVGCLSLAVPTGILSSARPGALTIDHIAVPARTRVSSATQVRAAVGDRRLSDHDAYVVDVDL